MARTSAKAKKSKQEVNKKKEEAKVQESKTGNESTGDSTDKENDSVNYDVEKITHTRIFKGKRQYLVRWKGYSEDNDTWETESALQSCKEILDAFKKEHLANADSDDDSLAEEIGEKNEKIEDKKEEGKKEKKNMKKTARQSKSKKENEDIESDENSDEKDKNEVKEKNIEETIEELDVISKTKKAKGKKRNASKEAQNSKAKKSKKVKNESDDESITDGKDYEVEKILEVHTRKDGSREFLIRWKGYKPSDDTWEPEAHLDCQELIDKFMEKVEKVKELGKKELRENRVQAKRFVPLNSRIASKRSQRNSGVRPCYQETYED